MKKSLRNLFLCVTLLMPLQAVPFDIHVFHNLKTNMKVAGGIIFSAGILAGAFITLILSMLFKNKQ